MKKNIIIAASIMMMAISTQAQAAADKYVVKKGDTLWSIAGQFYNNPAEWVKIYNANKSIENPNLIYPNDVILFDKKSKEISVIKAADVVPEIEKVEKELPPEVTKLQEKSAAEVKAEIDFATEVGELNYVNQPVVSENNLNGFYAGFGVSNLSLTIPAIDGFAAGKISSNVSDLHVGYDFSTDKSTQVKIEYRRFLTKINGVNSQTVGNTTIRDNYKIKNIQSALFKIGKDFGKFNVTGIAGYSTAKLNAVFNTNSAGVKSTGGFNEKLKSFSYGGSVGYNISNNIAINAEYLQLLKSKDFKVRSIGANVEYKF